MSVFEYAHILHDIVRKPFFVNFGGNLSTYIAPSVVLPVTIVEGNGVCTMRFSPKLSFPFKYLNVTFQNESFSVPPNTFVPRYSITDYGVNMGPNFREATAGEVSEDLVRKINAKAERNASNRLLEGLMLGNVNQQLPNVNPPESLKTVNLSVQSGAPVPNTSEKFIPATNMTVCRNPSQKVNFSMTDDATDAPTHNTTQNYATDSTVAPGPGQAAGYPPTTVDNPSSVEQALTSLLDEQMDFEKQNQSVSTDLFFR